MKTGGIKSFIRKNDKKEECVFCKIIKKEVLVDIIEETENFLCFPDASPIAEGHSLIIPKKHFVSLLDLPSDLAGEMMDLIKRTAEKRLKEGAEGFNLVMNNFPAAGQLVMHAHIHLVPRKKDDRVKFPTI